jgi:hypothetical protein
MIDGRDAAGENFGDFFESDLGQGGLL